MAKKFDLRRSGSWIGLAAMAVVLFLYASSGLLAPWWAVVALLVFWVFLFALSCRWFSLHPRRVALIPVVAVAVWFAVMYAGGAALGWTA